MIVSEKWEIYDVRLIPTGKKTRFPVFIRMGLFRKLEKNPQTLTYEYTYKEKQLTYPDYEKFMNSNKRLDYWRNQLKLLEAQTKKTSGKLKTVEHYNKKTKEFIGLKYMTDYKPAKMRTRNQKFNGI